MDEIAAKKAVEKEKLIVEIVKNYPEKDWLNEIQKQIPDISINMAIAYIEIANGGDVIALDEE